LSGAVFVAAEKEAIFENLAYAGFVSGNWLIKEKFPALKKAVGKTMDPIADMLIRIKNAQAVKHQTVDIPYSKLKMELAKILETEGLIKSVEVQGKKIKKNIGIELKYQKGEPIAANLRKISKPGCRIYRKKEQIRPVRQGYGISIISTPQGLMTDKEARKRKIGGEVLCEIW